MGKWVRNIGGYWVYEQMSWVYQPQLGAIKATKFWTKLLRGTYPIRKLCIYIFFPDVVSSHGSGRRGDYLEWTPILMRTETALKSDPTPILCVQKKSKISPNIDPIWVQKTLVGTELWSNLSTEVDFSQLFFFFFWNLSTILNKLTSELVIASSPSLDLIKMNGVSLHRSNLPLPPPPISFWNAPSSTPHRGVVASILCSLFGQSQLSHVIRNASISQPVHFHSFSRVIDWIVSTVNHN